MTFFYRNILLLHILLLAVAYSWLHGGLRPDLLLPVIPWLTFFMVETLLIFPQAKRSETLVEARQRVWRALVRDPLLYLLGVFSVLLVMPLFNATGEPQLNLKTRAWQIAPPPLSGMPFCVDPLEHASLLLWFIPVLLAALAVKHGLLKSGKRLLLKCFCWNGALLAILGFMQLLSDASSPYWGSAKFSYFFSSFGYPNVAGAFFTLLFALSLGLWFGGSHEENFGPNATTLVPSKEHHHWYSSSHWLSIPAILNFSAAIATLCRAAMLLTAVVFLIYGVYMILGLWQIATRGGRVLISTSIIGVVFVATLGLMILAPQTLKEEIVTITPDAVAERVTGRGYYHTRLAKAIYSDHKLFGVGGWGYPHFSLIYATPEERRVLQVTGGANVHNDSLQFLAEQGLVGYSIMLLCILSLSLPPLWQSGKLSYQIIKAKVDSVKAQPRFLFLIAPEIAAIYLGTAATVAHSFGDLPFRSPAVLIIWLLALAAAPGFMPTLRSSKQLISKPEK